MTVLIVVATAASALMAGLFFGFSTFAMDGLRRIPSRSGLVAMQGINSAATRSAPFLTVFLGGGLLAVALGIAAATRLDDPDAPYVLAGSVANVVGVVVTAGFHVPRNNALDRVDPDHDDAAGVWAAYAKTWTQGNHVRTLSYLVGTVALAIALYRR